MVAAGIAAIVLVGCGAVIDTRLLVGSDGSGERIMTLSLPAEQADELVGGVAAADASIRRHLPESLDYSGIEVRPNGGLEATFTLSFGSAEEYIDETNLLLAASGSEYLPSAMTVADSLLVSGVTVKEEFDSRDLLAWMFAGLVVDGVLSSDLEPQDMYEFGSTVLQYGTEEAASPSERIEAEILEGRGFDSVSMETRIEDPSAFRRTITFAALDPDAAAMTRIDEFFATSAPEGAVLVRNPASWDLTFEGDASDIENGTDRALATSGSVFDVDVTAMAGDPASLSVAVTEMTDCASVCNADAPHVVDRLTTGPGFLPGEAEIELAGEQSASFQLAPEISAVEQTLRFGFLGDIAAETRFTVANEDVALVGTGFEELLSRGVSGTVSSSRSDADTTYTVTIAGGSPDEFNAAYAMWAGGGGIGAAPAGGFLVGATTEYEFQPNLDGVTGMHPVIAGASTTVGVAPGQWVTDGDTASGAYNQPVAFRISGFTPSGVIVAIFTALVLAAAAYFLIHRRAALRSRLAAVRAAPQWSATTDPSGSAARGSSGGVPDDRSGALPHPAASLFDVPPAPAVHPIASLLDAPPTGPALSVPPHSLLSGAAAQQRTAAGRPVSLLDLQTPADKE